MFDAATLREEISIHVDHEGKLRPGANVKYAVKCFRELRRIEDRERDDIPRSSVTGY